MRFVEKLRYYLRKNIGKRHAFRHAQQTLLKSGSLTDAEKKILSGVSLRVRDRDWGYLPGRADQYLSVGLGALRLIEMGLERMDRKPEAPIKAILDFPCGSGRVLRFLRVRFPAASIYGAELNKGALRFCEKNFAVVPIVSDLDFSKISLSQGFDLIWCGSLVTHLSESATRDLLGFFYRHLNEGGMCVFTTHGQHVLHLIENKGQTYMLDSEQLRNLMQQYRDSGYGYVEHKNIKGYGVSLSTPDRVRSLASMAGGWKEKLYVEHGWDNHQDVWVYVK